MGAEPAGIGAEIDARGHLAPKAKAFRERCAPTASTRSKRDAAFGSGFAAVRGRDPD